MPSVEVNIYGVPNKANIGRIAIQPDIYHGISKENRDATANGSVVVVVQPDYFQKIYVAILSTKQKYNSKAQLVAPAYRFRSSKDQYYCSFVTSYEPELQPVQFRSLLTMNACSRLQKNRGIPKTLKWLHCPTKDLCDKITAINVSIHPPFGFRNKGDTNEKN